MFQPDQTETIRIAELLNGLRVPDNAKQKILYKVLQLPPLRPDFSPFNFVNDRNWNRWQLTLSSQTTCSLF